MEGLGRLFDAVPVIAVVDLAGGAVTGNPVSLINAEGITFLVYLDAAASGTEDVVITVREAQDGSGTGEQDLDTVTKFYHKAEATLDNDETWSEETQTAGDITLDGATFATSEVLVAFYVSATELSDGFSHVTVDIADVGTVARSGGVIGLLSELAIQRAPDNLTAPQ